MVEARNSILRPSGRRQFWMMDFASNYEFKVNENKEELPYNHFIEVTIYTLPHLKFIKLVFRAFKSFPI